MEFLAQPWPYDRWQDAESLVDAVEAADRLGFSGFCLSEHLFTSPEHRDGFGNDTWYDPFVLSAYMAGRTRQIRFVFKVMVVPIRHPLHTARMAATIDQLSGGRLILGVAAGWCAADFEAVGIPFESRGALTDEYLSAMRSWWTEDRPTQDGSFGRWTNVIARPKCRQDPHVPLWIGGSGQPSLRRAAAYGDGWMPMPATTDFDDAVRSMEWIRRRAEAAGRDPERLRFVWRLDLGELDEAMVRVHRTVHRAPEYRADRVQGADQVVEAVSRYADVGITDLEVSFSWRDPTEFQEKLTWFSEEVVPLSA